MGDAPSTLCPKHRGTVFNRQLRDARVWRRPAVADLALQGILLSSSASAVSKLCTLAKICGWSSPASTAVSICSIKGA
jgi:hypothetical protein